VRLTQSSSGPVIFVGMDAPDLPSVVVSRAADTARRGRAVVHDATDGGYVLCALPEGCPGSAFDDVEWSTARTAASQKARFEALGVDVAPIDASVGPWSDVDEPDDLRRLLERLDDGRSRGDDHLGCPALEAIKPRLLAVLADDTTNDDEAAAAGAARRGE